MCKIVDHLLYLNKIIYLKKEHDLFYSADEVNNTNINAEMFCYIHLDDFIETAVSISSVWRALRYID